MYKCTYQALRSDKTINVYFYITYYKIPYMYKCTCEELRSDKAINVYFYIYQKPKSLVVWLGET